MAGKGKDIVAKLVGVGATVLAASVAQKVVARAWRMAVGHEPPAPEDDSEDIRFAEVALAAVITGAAAYLSRVLATRGTSKLLKR